MQSITQSLSALADDLAGHVEDTENLADRFERFGAPGIAKTYREAATIGRVHLDEIRQLLADSR